MIHGNLGIKRPGVNTSPKSFCKRCGAKKFKRELRLKSGRTVKLCKDCRNIKTISKRSKFAQNLLAIHLILKAGFIEQKTKGKEVKNMAKINGQARQYASNLVKLPDQLATIIGKTYSVRGDDYVLADDEALTRIRDLLEAFDDQIIKRNIKKRLPR